MDIFRKHFAKQPPETQRRGLGQWFEILEEKIMDLIKVNFMTVLCLSPSVICICLGIYMKDFRLFPAGILFLICAGPAITAMNRICLRMVLRLHYWVWDDYKKCIKQEWKSSMLLTLLLSILWGILIYAIFLILAVENGMPVFLFLFFIVYIYLLTGFTIFSYQQLSMVDLPLKDVLTNAVLMIFSGGIRSFGAIAGTMVLAVCAYMYLLWGALLTLIVALALWTMTTGVICRKEMEASLRPGDDL